jgi:hypothetical protein
LTVLLLVINNTHKQWASRLGCFFGFLWSLGCKLVNHSAAVSGSSGSSSSVSLAASQHPQLDALAKVDPNVNDALREIE